MRRETIARFKRSNGAGCSGASSWTDGETGDAPNPRQTRVYHLERDEFSRRPRRTYREIAREQSGKPGDAIHVRAYRSADWFTTRGVLRKRRLIERKGLPSFNKWRFITLTLSRDAFDSPLSAYLAGKAKLRKWMHAARKAGLWKPDARWCWKLEFQKDGWAHWHLLVERREIFSGENLVKLSTLWGLGRVNVQMVRNSDFLYQFKYAFKPVMSEDAERHAFCVPAWFADFVGRETVTVKPRASDDFEPYEAEKSVTFARARFWQTSKDFYATPNKQSQGSDKEQQTWSVAPTVRDVVERKSCTVQICARTKTGRYVASGVITLSVLTGHFWDRVGFEAFLGGAVGLGVNSYVIPAEIIERNTQSKWLLQTLRKKNRLTILRAEILRNNQVSLARC